MRRKEPGKEKGDTGGGMVLPFKEIDSSPHPIIHVQYRTFFSPAHHWPSRPSLCPHQTTGVPSLNNQWQVALTRTILFTMNGETAYQRQSSKLLPRRESG
jgi:hypothetical protein